MLVLPLLVSSFGVLLIHYGVAEASLRPPVDSRVGPPSPSSHFMYRRWIQDQQQPTCDWTQVGGDIDGEAPGDGFGSFVAMSRDGNVVAVGARYNDGTNSTSTMVDAGHVRVFTRRNSGSNPAETTGAVVELQQLGSDIDGETAGDQFGLAIALSGNGHTIAIGAPLFKDFANGGIVGRVRVYEYSPVTEVWNRVGSALDGEAEGQDAFWGVAVALSGNGTKLAIGGLNNGSPSLRGHVGVFQLVSSVGNSSGAIGEDSQWVQIGQQLEGNDVLDSFGVALSLSEDGHTVAVGAFESSGSGAPNSGQVRVFRYDPVSDEWNQVGDDINGLPVENLLFGSTVSLSADGKTVAAGAPGDVNLDPVRGYAQVFALTETIEWAPVVGSNATQDFSFFFESNATVSKTTTFQWVQLGSTIDGKEDGDRAGSRVALSPDGRTVVVASFLADGPSAEDSGHVRVYGFLDDEWVQIGRDIGGEAEGDRFGSVGLTVDDNSDFQMVIGGQSNDGNGDNSGHARLFTIESSCAMDWLGVTPQSVPTASSTRPTPAPTNERSSCMWAQIGIDVDGGFLDQLGASVAFSDDGKTLAVGGRGQARLVNAGYVQVFTIDDDMQVKQLGRELVGAQDYDLFGSSIDLSSDGRILAVGAPMHENARGHVRVYRFSIDTDDWEQVGQDIDGQGTGTLLFSGYSVSLSANGSVVAIGTPNLGSIYGGHVEVYELRENVAWEQKGRRVDLQTEFDELGTSVSLSADGGVLAVGAYSSEAAGVKSGQAFVFKYNDASGWTQLGNSMEGQEPFAGFGFQVALSSDGQTVATVAKPQDSSNTGRARVFYLTTDLEWIQLGKDIIGDGTGSEVPFGKPSGLRVSLSADGRTLAVGAPGNGDLFGSETGRAYTYTFSQSVADWIPVGSILVGEAPGDEFGYSITLSASGTSLAVGGPFNDRGAQRTGHFRVYSIPPTCLTSEDSWVAQEALVVRVALNFSGVDRLTSDDLDAFTFQSKAWYDAFFYSNVESVQTMVSSFAVKEQIENSDETELFNVTIIYDQRISYYVLMNTTLTAEELVLLPFRDSDESLVYGRLLAERIDAFASVQLPLGVPTILPVMEVPGNGTSGRSPGWVVGIVAGAVACSFVVAGFVFMRKYKASLPVGDVVDDDASTYGSTPIAYRVEESQVALADQPPPGNQGGRMGLVEQNHSARSPSEDSPEQQVAPTPDQHSLEPTVAPASDQAADSNRRPSQFVGPARASGIAFAAGGSQCKNQKVGAVAFAANSSSPDYKDQVNLVVPEADGPVVVTTDQGQACAGAVAYSGAGVEYKDQVNSAAPEAGRPSYSVAQASGSKAIGAVAVSPDSRVGIKNRGRVKRSSVPGAHTKEQLKKAGAAAVAGTVGTEPQYKDQVNAVTLGDTHASSHPPPAKAAPSKNHDGPELSSGPGAVAVAGFGGAGPQYKDQVHAVRLRDNSVRCYPPATAEQGTDRSGAEQSSGRAGAGTGATGQKAAQSDPPAAGTGIKSDDGKVIPPPTIPGAVTVAGSDSGPQYKDQVNSVDPK